MLSFYELPQIVQIAMNEAIDSWYNDHPSLRLPFYKIGKFKLSDFMSLLKEYDLFSDEVALALSPYILGKNNG